MKLAALKGDDYYRTQFVADACSKDGGFHVLLAHMQKLITRPNDEEYEDSEESKLSLERIVELQGFELQTSLKISEDCVLQQTDLYNNRAPDEQMGGEYLGNQHAEIDHFYSDTVSREVAGLGVSW